MPQPDAETYTIDEAAESLGVPADDIRSYIEEDLLEEVELADGAVLSRAQMRRLWSVVTLHRDLGLNLAGVQAVLQLRSQYERIRRDLELLVEIVERELGPDVWDRLWPEERPHPRVTIQVQQESRPAAPPEGEEPTREPPSDEDGQPEEESA